MDEYSEQELLDMQARINRLLANAERARTWMRPMTDTDVYPADWRWRATRRAEIREKQREHAEAEATRLGRSLKCGIDHRHADQVGGCLNDGSTCLCECHDAADAPTSVPACDWFRWIGQPITSCDGCGRPAWEHKGELTGGGDPFSDNPGHREWTPGEADAMRARCIRSITPNAPKEETRG